MCNNKSVKCNSEILHIPYFEEVLSTTILCEKCNYRYSDILITSQNKPMEYKYKITSIDDMKIRVIRSSTATIELPELGIKIEPAAASEAFISNIEGVLVRAAQVIEQAIRFAGENNKKNRGKQILNQIEKLRNGKGSATLTIKDPMGNSGIVSKKTEKRELGPTEVESLETGITIIDLTKADVSSIINNSKDG